MPCHYRSLAPYLYSPEELSTCCQRPAAWTRKPAAGALFRIFHYPPGPADDPDTWGVGEHTDYGLPTLLLQDDNGGLQDRTGTGWIEAPPARSRPLRPRAPLGRPGGLHRHLRRVPAVQGLQGLPAPVRAAAALTPPRPHPTAASSSSS
ncbi:2OG-Fe(II) oxygenase family protein [Nonomuraea thailandensis]